MTTTPVTQERIQIAKDFGLDNVDDLAVACREADVPFFVACALMEKESGGRNIWGNDAGGTFADLPDDFRVNYATWRVFEYYVTILGRPSNGVGPAQLTYPGFFTDMKKRNLRPWEPYDNMEYGLSLLALYKAKAGATWEDAGTAYNGSRAYGRDFADKVADWKRRLHI